jgi:hypothetical protein
VGAGALAQEFDQLGERDVGPRLDGIEDQPGMCLKAMRAAIPALRLRL